MAKTVSLAIDAASVVSKIAERYDLDLPSKIVMFHYDEEADTLYAHFKYPSKSVDSEVVDKHGEIILGLNAEGQIVNMTVINALMHEKVPCSVEASGTVKSKKTLIYTGS